MNEATFPRTTSSKIAVLTQPGKVAAYVDLVRKAADRNTKALGFLASSVYEEFARKGQLYIATTSKAETTSYAAHLLFDPRFPRAQILQMHCERDFRKQGIAKQLLTQLVEKLKQESFLSIQARVGSDLPVANAFWESQGFYVQRAEPGRGAKPRTINVRILELDTPQLFSRSSLATGVANPLGLTISRLIGPPFYLVDLNVLFDLACQRIRHDQAADLFRSIHAGQCRLGVSDEVGRELARTSRAGAVDPMLELVNTLPQFVAPTSEQLDVKSRLATLIFPDRSRLGILSANDQSDICHVETAIYHGMSGLITSDEAILRVAPEIEANFALRVLSPDAFKGASMEDGRQHSVVTVFDRKLELRPARANDENSIRQLLKEHGVSSSEISSRWISPLQSFSPSARYCAWIGEDLAGYIAWTSESLDASRTAALAIIDEEHQESSSIARLMLNSLLEVCATNGPREISLELVAQQSELRDYARQRGFNVVASQNALIKVAAGGILTHANWRANRDAIQAACGLKLPVEIPPYSAAGALIEVISPDGYRRYVSLEAIEAHLSPVLLCLPGRPAVLTPVERRFSEPLLGHSPQGSLLPAPPSSLYQDRNFLCGPNAIRKLGRNSLMFFYESGAGNGLQAVVAVARITRSYLKRRDEVDVSVLEKSVLTASALEDLGASSVKSVATIDNIFPLPNPVSLSFLRSIGLGSQNDLITTRQIANDQVQAILGEGIR